MVALIKRLVNNPVSSGVLLIIAAVAAMLAANGSATQAAYHQFLQQPVGFHISDLKIEKNFLLWINDALMALFFLMIGIEVKEEIRYGALNSRQKAIFPVVAALGGMVVPALIFALLSRHDPEARIGWAIPVATDIAFALGVLSLIGKRVPPALRIFLMALAIIDDLGAVIIIALFYTAHLSTISLTVAAGVIALMALLNLCKVRNITLYLLAGVILWVAVLKSGVHATLAGVITGFFLPAAPPGENAPAATVKHGLEPWVNWLILPLFAFANAGIPLQGVTLSGLAGALPLGVMLGLFIGKPLGISLFCLSAIKLKLAQLPSGISFKLIMAVSVLCGIGFTMSIFIASLSFGDGPERLMTYSRLGILLGSLLAAVCGYVLLRMVLARQAAR